MPELNEKVASLFGSKTTSAEAPAVPNEAAPNPDDVEALSSHTGLERTLTSRHLQFIAIGGTVGTGLFLGTGGALGSAGPAALLIAFAFVGAVVYSVMISLSEMATYVPVAGAFTTYATRFVDPSLGLAMGWVYWLSWALTFALELNAAGLIIQYWNKSLSVAIFIAVFWVIFTVINFLPAKIFAEIEMYLASIKVVTIVGFVILSICINAGVGDQGYLGFKYWHSPGAFKPDDIIVDSKPALGKFVSFWSVLVTAGFSFQGTELVGIAAGETLNPRKTIPSAIRWTFWGIFTLFISTVFFLGLNIPYDEPQLMSNAKDASASPLVVVVRLAGIPVLPDIINAVLLTAVLSAANSNVYSSSRILVSLADGGHAPKFFKRSNKWGIPYYAVGVCSAVGLLAFMNLGAGGAVVFDWFLAIVTVAGLICWALTNIAHLRFMEALKYKGISRDDLPYKAPFQPYFSWFGLFFSSLIALTSGFQVFIKWETSAFFTNYISIIIFVVLYGGAKLWTRSKVVPLEEVDLSHNEK
ncbi:Arginine permease-like protein [Emericellopsis cladophorae]|uniref:Arginine permease-like protein n=1 Tax=Emericellopsis cladophorae TaxID=2686198 RepID=A0A9Q0BGG6_9HYPO|nr:Arginine permease-like protein [Emericellopsis cladophorae]KAI6783966.1 Arginine permease-like protein [Emericellopsis cladophorae]